MNNELENIEIDSIIKFKADVEIRDRQTIEHTSNAIVTILNTTEKMTLVEINKVQYNVIGNIKDFVKTEFAIEDFAQAVLTFLFAGILVLAYSQIALILEIAIVLNFGFIIMIFGLTFAITIFFLGLRKFTKQKVRLTLAGKMQEEKEINETINNEIVTKKITITKKLWSAM